MSARDNEVVWEADIPEKMVTDLIWSSSKAATAAKPESHPPVVKKPVLPSRKKRTRKN
jgi:hypothetical protein